MRERVAAKLGRPVPDAMWDYIVEMGFYGDAEAQPESDRVQYLADRIREVIRAAQPRAHADSQTVVAPDRPRGASVSARIDALSAIYAAWANHDQEVEYFRTQALVSPDTPEFHAYIEGRGSYPDYQLLAPEQVSSWIKDKHNVVSPDGDGDEHVRQLIRRTRPSEPNPIVHLRYVADGREQILTADARSRLGDLAKVADKLANRYRWQSAEAATFALTGRIPEVFVYTGSAQIRYGNNGSGTRVTMTLDPFLTPDQVADIYGRLRAQLRPGSPRSLSVKHYRLAHHIGPHVTIYVDQPAPGGRPGRPPAPGPTGLAQFIDPISGYTWQSLRRDWNDTYGDQQENGRSWRYEHASNFTRDAKDALERLLNPGWRMGEMRIQDGGE